MSDDLVLETGFSTHADRCESLSPLVRRIVANNPSPFTFTGTCSYIVGRGQVAVIDPGPALTEHVAAILDAVRGETVSHVVVSHTHKDHSPAARLLKDATGARIVGCGLHRSARPLFPSESNALESSGDRDYAPDLEMREGDAISGPGWSLTAVETPGHTANHLAFALPEEACLFSADHVMAWSTSVVAPPDGSMQDYIASLEKLRDRGETVYWPGHGGPVREPQRFVRALLHHRRQREASILNRLAAGDRTIPEIVAAIYQGLNPALQGAAGLSVFAHLEDLVSRGLAATDGEPSLTGRYGLS
ncbi:MBL fold metallo-hydrolase [Microvirga pudoricolor]|uniref:MBL fold metallo-hydrolase n=1 Tax=Microvirga pudoricolor TaxID=2778729 RepID=UPI001950EB95|nr:MBL fold metallo-hydrolase [Microvirga pudoricolor]MBM6592627.1 MBL fold metallo-hydrolase [Microvirga pudoricolor]